MRFAYEWCDDSGSWFHSYGNENWEFDEHGLMHTPLRLHWQSASEAQDRPVPLAPGRRPMTIGTERLGL